ncbi:lipoyl(octanoyl) transferase LipB [Frigoribacterium sp. 9N]|uniref:lipoyl(octanoyl) transferase LipB n=1 Tax=Frigoribacterium sp. 9N TaxID=2653144 RepID=UPI0012F28411|nr:lipoyl(octanoyl) transferase LipB [Frigoribacterium sp. 9N]VXB23524.1 Octanoyltransferase [Frigoribacterium sp. 9N]
MTTTRRTGLTGPPLDYDKGLRLQRELHADVVAGRLDSALVLCQHPSVYTAGTRTQPADLPRDGSPVTRVDRGGRITWHGPGQLVAYPIVRLPEPLDVVAHVRALEACLIAVCAGVGVSAVRVEGRSGAWVRGPLGDEKVAAVGVRVAEGVTMHGVALNCDADLSPYAGIVPCGITDAGVTSLTRASGRRVAVTDVADALETSLTAYLTSLETVGRVPARPDPVGAHR